MKSTVAAGILLLFCFGLSVKAQSARSGAGPDSLAGAGQKLLEQSRWTEAAALFAQLVDRFPGSPDADYYLLARGKAEYYGGHNTASLITFDTFLNRFPESPYIPAVKYFRANAQYKAGYKERALGSYIDAYARSRDDRLDRLIVSSLSSYDVSRLETRLNDASSGLAGKRRCELARALAEKATQRNRPQDADRLRALCSSSKEPVAPAVTSRAIGDVCDVAMLVPLSGEYQSFGQDLFDGATIAAEFYRKETGKQISLTPYDTKGDPVIAARLVKGMSDSPVDALIGPLTSDEAEVTSAVLSCRDLPMIAPAATEPGLTELSDCSFQLCPNVALQGVQMAEYARNTLHADSAAVISSTASDQIEIVQAFVDRFKALGGKIVAAEYYRSWDKDYGTYINDIKSILLRHSSDSATYLDDKGDTLAPEATPVQVDCLFLPGTPDQIRLLLPQIRFYNLNGAYLGSDGWGDETVYALGDDVLKGAVFPSPFVRAVRSAEYSRFSDAFTARYNRKASRVAGLGYDALRILAEALKRGATTRRQLLDLLGATKGYDGAEGRVTFGAMRENVEMPLFKIVGGQPELVSTQIIDPIR